jgi:hypothetical protein
MLVERRHVSVLGVVAALAAACTAELRPLGRAAPGRADGGPDGAAPGASCVAETHVAERVPLDLLLLVDVSSSMSFAAAPGAVSKWQMARDALVGFIGDPNSAPLGVGLQVFPVPASCTRDGDCFPDERCQTRGVCTPAGGGVGPAPSLQAAPCVPGVPGLCSSSMTCGTLGRCARDGASCLSPGGICPGGDPANTCQPLPRACHFFDEPSPSCDPVEYQRVAVPVADVASNRTALARVLAAQHPETNFGTPLGPALRGGLDHLRAHLALHPDRRAALVVTTDAETPSCEPSRPSELAALLSAAREGTPGNPGIPSYVIGVFTADELPLARPTIDALATAGGTGAPLVLDPRENLAVKLQQALRQIQGAALPCEFMVPPRPAMRALDYDRVTVRFKGASGEEAISYVQAADRCHPTTGGWYFDVDPRTSPSPPSRILACEATCRRFRVDLKAQVELAFACQR